MPSLIETSSGLVWRTTIHPNASGYAPIRLYFDNGIEAAGAARNANAYLPDYIRGGVREVEVHFREVSPWKRAEMFPPGWAHDHLAKQLEGVPDSSNPSGER